VVVADKECEHTSVTASPSGTTPSRNAEEPVGGNSVGATLEGEYVAELIDLLVRKGARVAIQAEDRR